MGMVIAVIASLLLQAAAPLPPDYEKRRQLSEAVLGKRPATEGEVQALLEKAMKDPDPVMRREAVGIVASVAWISAMPQTPPGQEWAVRLSGVAQALSPAIEKALDDPDAGVRREALRGFVAGSFASAPSAALPLATLRRLATHYDRYPDAAGRSSIVMALKGSYKSDDAGVRLLSGAILKKAAQDADPYVVQAAGLSATSAGDPEVLSLLVAQLQNPSYVARMGVAQGIASYGAAARQYLPQLEAALAAETHDITKKTIAGTIAVIKR